MGHPLDQTLTCESYDDGTSYTIGYDEERSDPEIVEQFSPEGSGAVRTFYCAWTNRFNFVENMCGFSKVNPSGTNGISSDGTGFNGRHIHRKAPVGYHMGKLSSGNPSNWVYATRATIVPDGGKKNITQGSASNLPGADYAKITITYSALDYDVENTDSSILFTGSSGAGTVSFLKEWLRYGRIVQKPASLFFQFPLNSLYTVDNPAPGTNKIVPTGQNILDNIADFWVYLYDLPYDPIVGVNECFGGVNKFAIFATPDFTDGQPAESLHLIAADIVRLPLRYGRRYWNLQLGFRKVFNKDYDGTTFRGHNYLRDVYRIDNNTTQLRFYRACTNPASPTAVGSSMIPIVDFAKIFWITSAIP